MQICYYLHDLDVTSMWPRCDLDVISMWPRCDLDAQPRMVVWSWYLQSSCLQWLWRSTTQLTTGEARNERPYYDIVCKWRSTTPQPQAEARNERMRNVDEGCTSVCFVVSSCQLLWLATWKVAREASRTIMDMVGIHGIHTRTLQRSLRMHFDTMACKGFTLTDRGTRTSFSK